jgi:hypothetical protein
MSKRKIVRAESTGAKAKRVRSPSTAEPKPPRSILHLLLEIGDRIPEADRRRLPKDLARNHDKYLYGPRVRNR